MAVVAAAAAAKIADRRAAKADFFSKLVSFFIRPLGQSERASLWDPNLLQRSRREILSSALERLDKSSPPPLMCGPRHSQHKHTVSMLQVHLTWTDEQPAKSPAAAATQASERARARIQVAAVSRLSALDLLLSHPELQLRPQLQPRPRRISACLAGFCGARARERDAAPLEGSSSSIIIMTTLRRPVLSEQMGRGRRRWPESIICFA